MIANPSPDVYGSDLQMLESLVALREAGYRVVVALPQDGELVPRIRERDGEVAFVDFPVLRRANQSIPSFLRLLWSMVACLPRLIRFIRRMNPAAVYVNTVTIPWWLLAARLARVPVACHLHEAETTDSRLVRRALVAPLRLAHAVLVISRSTLDAMVTADPGLERKANLIYNGVPQPPAEPKPPARVAPIRLVVVGRLSPRKAPHLALEATAELRRQGYQVELELAGSAFPGYEWYTDQLKERSERDDLAGAVTFAGYCSPIWENLNRADIMVAPSLREPFGNAVVEAQYSLRPVVATAALGHTESITDGVTGLLVPAEDVAAMAAAIARLIDDPELAETLARTARAEAIRRFSVERYRAEVVQLFGRLTGETAGSTAAGGAA
ncbi:MAG: glycosyltransferase family 4 protein [Propionibacteriaceae bacterium]|nr:glycosyltransferase family 4 protein [Propionibacteriaceae bacterium]